jgi:large subunit ribosomal protein L15
MRLSPLNLDTIEELLASGRLDGSATITMKHLRDAGAVSKNVHDGIKLLGRGAGGFAASGLAIEVSRASDSARAAVAAAGGSVTTVHYNRLSLRALLKPERFAAAPGQPPLLPRPAAPPPKLRGRVDAIGGLPAGAPHTLLPRAEAVAAKA